MKLHLVNEDGTPARLDEIVAENGEVTIDIDGVPCRLVEYEGPDGKDGLWSAHEQYGNLRLLLEYENRRRDVPVTKGHRTYAVAEFDCAFSRRRRAREREGAS